MADKKKVKRKVEMNLGSFRTQNNVELHEDKDPASKGFCVEYEDGKKEWIPKDEKKFLYLNSKVPSNKADEAPKEPDPKGDEGSSSEEGDQSNEKDGDSEE